MDFLKLVEISKQHFPKLSIKYKDQSPLMKVLNIFLFFNFNFMSFTTVIGNTIYLPTKVIEENRELSRAVVFMHELVHLYDKQKMGKFGGILFSISYIFPQILVLLGIPALFISWKLAIFFLLFLAPLPAYWRMKYERRAYFCSLYVMKQFEKKTGVNYQIEENKKFFVSQFKGSNYYFMWYLPGISKQFDIAVSKIEKGKKPFEDGALQLVDSILEKI